MSEEISEGMKYKSVECPFCNEEDFDKVGLKYHLEWYCQEYKNIPATGFHCHPCMNEHKREGE